MNKQEKIQSIKDIIENYGGFDINETDHECPVISAIGNQSVLLERINHSDVECTEYVHETEVDYHSFEFEQLSEDILDDIFTIATDYAVSQEKLFNSCRNENF